MNGDFVKNYNGMAWNAIGHLRHYRNDLGTEFNAYAVSFSNYRYPLLDKLHRISDAFPQARKYIDALEFYNLDADMMQKLLDDLKKDLEAFAKEHFHPEHGRIPHCEELYYIDDDYDFSP